MPFLPPNQHRQSTEGIVVRMRQFATYDGRTRPNLCECWGCLHGTFIHTHMQRVVGVLNSYHAACSERIFENQLRFTELCRKFGVVFWHSLYTPIKKRPPVFGTNMKINLKKN